MVRWLIVIGAVVVGGCVPLAQDEQSPTDAEHAPADGGLPGDAGVPVDAGRPAAAVRFFATRDGGPALVDEGVYAEPFNVVVENLDPGQSVYMEARLWGYRSYGDFVVNDDGRLDLSRDAPVDGSGTYTGADADGLIWSMLKENGSEESNYDVTYSVWTSAAAPLVRTLVRRPMASDATIRDVDDDGLYGTLMVPPGAPRPVVVVVGGSEGGLEGALFSGAHVETMGYAVLALAYFGADGLPAALTEIPLEYFGTAFAWLRRQEDVDAEHIVFMGGSRGGELALLVGVTFPNDVDGVIAHVGSGLVFGSTALEDRSAWSLDGIPVPFLQIEGSVQPVLEHLPGGGVGYRWAPATEQAIRAMTPEAVAPATIAVESLAGPALIMAGADDGLWPSCYLSGIAWERLRTSGHQQQHEDVFACFADAGHWSGTPGWPTAESYSSTMDGQTIILGGTRGGNGRAGRAYDTLIRAFLRRVVP